MVDFHAERGDIRWCVTSGLDEARQFGVMRADVGRPSVEFRGKNLKITRWTIPTFAGLVASSSTRFLSSDVRRCKRTTTVRFGKLSRAIRDAVWFPFT